MLHELETTNQDFLLNEVRRENLLSTPTFDFGWHKGKRITLLVESFGRSSLAFVREETESGKERIWGTVGKTTEDAIYSLGFDVHNRYRNYLKSLEKGVK